MINIDFYFEKNLQIIKICNFEWLSLGINVKLEDYYINTDEKSIHCQSILPILSEKYWNLIHRFSTNLNLVTILSGLHFNINNFLTSRLFRGIYPANIIYHYHNWRGQDHIVEDEYAIIECEDLKTLKNIYNNYWFAIGKEVQMKILLMEKTSIPHMEPWSRLDEGANKQIALLNNSKYIFDNLHNGFHIKIETNKESESNFSQLISL